MMKHNYFHVEAVKSTSPLGCSFPKKGTTYGVPNNVTPKKTKRKFVSVSSQLLPSSSLATISIPTKASLRSSIVTVVRPLEMEAPTTLENDIGNKKRRLAPSPVGTVFRMEGNQNGHQHTPARVPVVSSPPFNAGRSSNTLPPLQLAEARKNDENRHKNTGNKNGNSQTAAQDSYTSYYEKDKQSLLLARPGDEYVLNPLHVFVRKQIEVFTVTSKELHGPCPGRKNPIRMHQVGIRCIHCRDLTAHVRVKRAVCYPISVGRIYSSVSDMKFEHFVKCQKMPAALKVELHNLRSRIVNGAVGSIHPNKKRKSTEEKEAKKGSQQRRRPYISTAQYYHDSAVEMGMVDYNDAIFLPAANKVNAVVRAGSQNFVGNSINDNAYPPPSLPSFRHPTTSQDTQNYQHNRLRCHVKMEPNTVTIPGKAVEGRQRYVANNSLIPSYDAAAKMINLLDHSTILNSLRAAETSFVMNKAVKIMAADNTATITNKIIDQHHWQRKMMGVGTIGVVDNGKEREEKRKQLIVKKAMTDYYLSAMKLQQAATIHDTMYPATSLVPNTVADGILALFL